MIILLVVVELNMPMIQIPSSCIGLACGMQCLDAKTGAWRLFHFIHPPYQTLGYAGVGAPAWDE